MYKYYYLIIFIISLFIISKVEAKTETYDNYDITLEIPSNFHLTEEGTREDIGKVTLELLDKSGYAFINIKWQLKEDEALTSEWIEEYTKSITQDMINFTLEESEITTDKLGSYDVFWVKQNGIFASSNEKYLENGYFRWGFLDCGKYRYILRGGVYHCITEEIENQLILQIKKSMNSFRYTGFSLQVGFVIRSGLNYFPSQSKDDVFIDTYGGFGPQGFAGIYIQPFRNISLEFGLGQYTKNINAEVYDKEQFIWQTRVRYGLLSGQVWIPLSKLCEIHTNFGLGSYVLRSTGQEFEYKSADDGTQKIAKLRDDLGEGPGFSLGMGIHYKLGNDSHWKLGLETHKHFSKVYYRYNRTDWNIGAWEMVLVLRYLSFTF